MADRPFFYMLGQLPFEGTIDDEFLTEDKSGLGVTYPADIRIVDHENTVVDDWSAVDGAAMSNTNSAATKLTVGPDVETFPRLLAEFPDGIHVLKLTLDGPVGGSTPGNRWLPSVSIEAWAAMLAADALLEADLSGDVKVPKAAMLSFGYRDALNEDADAVAELYDDLPAVIAGLRALLDPDLPIVFDMPPVSLPAWSAAANALLLAVRAAIRTVAGQDALVSYIYTDDLTRVAGGDGVYTGASMLELGRRLADRALTMLDPPTGAAIPTSTGVPTYVMLGDESVIGVVSSAFLVEGAAELPAIAGGAVKVWNVGAQTWEPYDGEANSNTAGEGATAFGPDAALMTELAARHTGQEVRFFKYGLTQTGLTVEGVNGTWDPAVEAGPLVTAAEEWRAALVAMAAEGLVADVRGIVWSQGRGDAGATEAAYRQALGILLAALRSTFGTRTESPNLTPVSISLELEDSLGDLDGVRLAQKLVALWEPGVELVDLDTATRHTDGVNLSGSGLLQAGRSMAVALDVAETSV